MPLFPTTIPWFGLQPPEDVPVVAAWGCRAILTGGVGKQYIDVLWDRKQLWTPDGADVVAFTDWLQAAVGPWLIANCNQSWIDPASSKRFELDAAPYHAVASPRASYGYLYVGAWQAEPPP
jgi:hypothetical protein